MRTRITIIIAGLGLGALVLAGCVIGSRQVVTQTPTGWQTNTVQVYELDETAGIAIAGVAAAATPFAVHEDPNAGPYLALVSQTFAAAANSGITDPAIIQAALDKISIRELRDNSTAKSLVKTAMMSYKSLAAEAVANKVDQTKWGPFAIGVLRKVAEGVTSGLASS